MKKQTLNFMFWNCCRGIFNKKSQIEKYIRSYHPLVFSISECDILEGQDVNLLEIKGYDLEVASTLMTRKKGRVLAYVDSKYNFRRMTRLENELENVIVLENKDTRVICVYAGFQTYPGETQKSNFARLLNTLDKSLNSPKTIIVGGDFNVDPSKEDAKAKDLSLLSTEHGLSQLITEPTWTRLVDGKVYSSMLDHIYTNDPEKVKIQTEITECSDHLAIVAKLERTILSEVLNKKKVILDWRKFKDDSFNAMLDANAITPSDNVNQYDREIVIAMTKTLNQCVPMRVVHLRRNNDLESTQIQSLKNRRDRLFKKARKKNSAALMEEVKWLNKEIKRVVNKEKKRVISKKIEKSSTQGFWNTVNNMLGRNRKDDEFPIEHNGTRIPPDELPEHFRNFFLNKVTKLIGTPTFSDIQKSPYRIAPFTESEIRQAISSFQPKKSSGPDDIPMLTLKVSQNKLMPHIVALFEQISQQCKMPKAWKMARIKPIFKKGDKSEIQNYRPISNLNSLSKIFERCILNRLPSEVDGNNQHGFKKEHSTTTACLEIQSTLASLMDKGEKCVIYSADLSAAFDVIRPDIFHKKAKMCIGEELTDLIYELITDRQGFVEVDGFASTFFKFPAGCPQGSALGPKIFNIYSRDLNDHLSGEGVWLTTYADDSYVIVSGREDLEQKVKETMEKHLKWLSENGLVCNVEKTELMTLGAEKVTIEVSDKKIHSTDSMKVLGLTFDSKLDWGKQISNTIAKCSRTLHGLKHIRKYLRVEKLKQVITAFFFSVMNYGMEVWFHPALAFHHKRKIRALHYKALRLVFGKMPKEELNKMRAPPDQMALFLQAKQLINIMNKKVPFNLFNRLDERCYIERRVPWRFQFHATNARRIGKQCFENRAALIAKHLKFDWAIIDSKDVIRTNLKKTFF